MPVQEWSDDILVVELNDDPQFSDDMTAAVEAAESSPRHVVLNMSTVGFINSSNIAKLLRLRKQLIGAQKRMILCGVTTQVWGVLMVTGLDKILEFTKDIATALATVQLTPPKPKGSKG
jgi:anti-anti-sigma factor